MNPGTVGDSPLKAHLNPAPEAYFNSAAPRSALEPRFRSALQQCYAPRSTLQLRYNLSPAQAIAPSHPKPTSTRYNLSPAPSHPKRT